MLMQVGIQTLSSRILLVDHSLTFSSLLSPATVFRTGDPLAYKSMCRMYTLLWASGPTSSS